MVVLVICQKNRRRKQLHFSKFDESFHDFTGKTIHSSVDSGNSRF
jgi:hypothetical protein